MNSTAAPVAPQKESRAKVVAVIVGHVATSVSLILLNKIVMNEYGFKYVFSLSLAHMLFTGVSLFLMGLCGRFEVRHMTVQENVLLAATHAGSICFMNLSLEKNSLGFYQMCKLMAIPCIVGIERMVYNASFSRKVVSSLFVIIGGVGIATVTDVQMTPVGLIYGILAVLSTAVSHILISRKQKEYGMDAFQIMRSVAFYQVAFTFLCVIIFELQTTKNVLEYQFETISIALILCTCPLALCAQILVGALVRLTSAVTYQVVGHSKTCLIFLFGFLSGGYGDAPLPQLLKNLTGVLLAMAGVVLYGHLRLAETTGAERDWCDRFIPGFVLHFLKASEYTKLDAEEQDEPSNDKDTESV